MTYPNHIVGGLAITGIIGSLAGINILEQESYIAITVVASLLPDIDHTKSPIGKLFYPIAKSINRRYGHRTITHTLVVLIGLWALVASIGKAYFDTSDYGTIFFIAYLSHLLLDMMTIQGVPLFYPFFKNPCVIPGDPNLRIRTADIRAELTAFVIFCMMFVFFQPLMKTGFWTQYNRYFSTPKHLASEFKKSEDLLEAAYWGRIGSQPIAGKGYVIDAKESKAILIENGAFRVLDKNKMVIEKVLPTHTGKRFYFDTQHFIAISTDSLNRLLTNEYIYQIEIHSEQGFHAYIHSIKQSASRTFKGDLYTNIYFQEAEQELPEQEIFTPTSNPQIPLLQDKLQRLREQQRSSATLASKYQTQLTNLQQQAQQEINMIQRELLYDQLKELKKQTPKSPDYESKIAETEIRIQELTKLDAKKNQEGRREVERKNRSIQIEDTRLTGFAVLVRIEK